VQYVLTAVDGLRPAHIPFEIGFEKGQTIARLGTAFLQHGANATLSLQAPYRGPHLMARVPELKDQWAPMKPDPPVTRIVLAAAYMEYCACFDLIVQPAE
jgi:hypothetical protein